MLLARSVTVKRLIHEAYQLPYYQISGGPGWLDSDKFDVDAKAATAAGADQIRVMLRALLASQFRLASHREAREAPVLALVQQKGGARIQAATSDRALPPSAAGQVRFRYSLTQFSEHISAMLQQPVLNRTGLEGTYDISMSVEQVHDSPNDPISNWQRSLEPLGLRLERQSAALDFLIIEHAEKPPVQ